MEKSLAWAKFQSLQRHLPAAWDENAVAEFHEIVSALETAFEIDLSRFRIPDSEMKQYAVSMHRRSQYGRFRAKTRLTDVRYCDDELVLKQVAGIAKRMHTLVQSLDMLRVAA